MPLCRAQVFSTSTQVVGKGQSGKISGHNAFDPRKSSTWKDSAHQAWQISYGDGSTASGTVGTDVVSIGGLKIQKQSIEMASQLSSQFAQGSSDGLLGLAFPSINTITSNGRADPQPTPVANMIRQGDIPKNTELFTSAFYSSKDKAADSFYTFGFIDQDLVKASGKDIVWTDIDNSQGFWMFASTSATINGKKVTRDNNTAIADTGTTLALVSDDVCEALYGAIKGATYSEEQQGWLIPTSVTAADLPNFSLAVGDTEFTIQKEDLLFAAADDKNWYGGVQSRGENPFDILGDTFLKSIYAVSSHIPMGSLAKRWALIEARRHRSGIRATIVSARCPRLNPRKILTRPRRTRTATRRRSSMS